MSFSVRSPVLLAAGALLRGCAVYDTDLISSAGGVSKGGSPATDGGQSGDGNLGGGSMPSAGAVPSGGKGSGAAGTDQAGAASSEGGAGNEGGEDPSAIGGVAGDAGDGGAAGGPGKAGQGGTAGSAPIVTCDEHPLSSKTSWVATASSFSQGNGTETDGLFNPPSHMSDGNFGERWSSGKPQTGDEWIQIDFGVVVNVSNVTLHVGNDTGDYPRKYSLRISNESDDFAAPVRASGDGMPGNTVITLVRPVTGRYLTVRQTGANPVGTTSWWTIAEVLVTCTE
jgi:hypothetical protein